MTAVFLGMFSSFCWMQLCAKYAEPSVQTPSAFKEMTPVQSSETDGWKTAEPNDDMLRGKWWEMFGDTRFEHA